eukprot:scaffold166674_cov26-Cyclotella_meneghiniana.AAC.1
MWLPTALQPSVPHPSTSSEREQRPYLINTSKRPPITYHPSLRIRSTPVDATHQNNSSLLLYYTTTLLWRTAARVLIWIYSDPTSVNAKEWPALASTAKPGDKKDATAHGNKPFS